MKLNKHQKLAAAAGLASTLAAASFAALAVPSGSMKAAGFFGTSLSVGSVTGPDAPLAWKSTKIINAPESVPFRWSTTDANAGYAKWTVVRVGTTAELASGVLTPVPPSGQPRQFSIDFRKFLPANPTSAGIKYDVTVSTYRRIAITSTGGARGPAIPISTSPKATVVYAKGDKPIQFDDDMGYSRRNIRIAMQTLDVGDEDDPTSSDEPFMVLVQFKFRAQITGGKAKLMPGTLQVGAVEQSAHNNLGHGDDNWVDEDEDPYDLSAGNLVVNTTVPTGQPGWVVGAVAVMFEEDAFSDSRAVEMRDLIVSEATKAIQTLDFSNINASAISDPLVSRITGQITSSFKMLNFGLVNFLKGFAEAIDPDDIAGVNVVVAATVPGGKLRFMAGQPPSSANDLILQSIPVNGPQNFALSYPIGDLSSAPGIARYQGQMTVRGQLTTSLIR